MLGRLAFVSLLAALSLAGCTGEDDEGATIAYHGGEPGRDAKGFQCMDDDTIVSLQVTYKGDVGKSFTVKLQAPGGPFFFNQTFMLPGPAEQDESFSEPALGGAWTLIVERHDPFQGKISVTAKCI